MTFTEKWSTRSRIRFGDPCFECGIAMTPNNPIWARKNGLIPDDMRQHGSHGLCSSCAHARRDGRLPHLNDLCIHD